MAELELKETKKDVTQEFEPIAVNEEISVKFNKNITAGKRRFYGVAVKDGKEIGRATWSDDAKRLIVMVDDIDKLGDETAKEVADTLYSGVLQMLNA